MPVAGEGLEEFTSYLSKQELEPTYTGGAARWAGLPLGFATLLLDVLYCNWSRPGGLARRRYGGLRNGSARVQPAATSAVNE